MSEGYEIISARLLKDVCQKKEWHSLKRILGIVLNKLNKTSTGVNVFKNKIENPFLQEITTATIFNKYVFIYILMAALGVCCCAWGFLQLRQAGLLFVAVCRLLFALLHVGSFQTWDQTYVQCIGSQILNHWTTREAPPLLLSFFPVIFLCKKYFKSKSQYVQLNIQFSHLYCEHYSTKIFS